MGRKIEKFELSKESASNEHGMLARLWRKIIFENNLEKNLLYFIDRYSRRLDVSKKKSKGVVVKVALDKQISFKSFLFLLFEVLRIKKVRLCVELDWGKRTTKHCINILPETLNATDEDVLEENEELQKKEVKDGTNRDKK